MAMNPPSGSWITSLRWHESGELSDEGREIVICAMAQAHDQSVLELNDLLEKALLLSAC